MQSFIFPVIVPTETVHVMKLKYLIKKYMKFLIDSEGFDPPIARMSTAISWPAISNTQKIMYQEGNPKNMQFGNVTVTS